MTMTVLCVEDDFDDYDFFCDIVKELDATVSCVNVRNGQDAIEFLENTSEVPDIIFMDMNMPKQDGKGCLRNIKRDPRLKSIPVVIYTTSQDVKDQQQCLELGASDFIRKSGSVAE